MALCVRYSIHDAVVHLIIFYFTLRVCGVLCASGEPGEVLGDGVATSSGAHIRVHCSNG